jgi:transposase
MELSLGPLPALVRGILPIIPPRSDLKVPAHPDYRRYKDRNRVEVMFGKLKQPRRIATRYDKAILSCESFLTSPPRAYG